MREKRSKAQLSCLEDSLKPPKKDDDEFIWDITVVLVDETKIRRGSMTRLFVIIVVTFALISGTALAQSTLAERGPFGLGVMYGMAGPSIRYLGGINAKYFLDETHAFAGAVLRRLSSKNDWYIHADYLYHFRSLIPVERGELPVYVGVGGRVLTQESNEDKVGVRFPVGLAYEFAGAPVDVFLEVTPIWEVQFGGDFDLEGGVGVRFFF